MTGTPVRLALAAAAVAGLAACNPLTAPTAPTTTTPKPTEADSYQGQLLTLVNVERTKAHLQPLALINCVDAYSDSWAATMARTGTLGNQNMTPVAAACNAHGAGENVGQGPITAQAMMASWMNSAPHRANILNPVYSYVGVGAAKSSTGSWFAVQDFIAP